MNQMGKYNIFLLFIEERYLGRLCICPFLYYRLFHWDKFDMQGLLCSSGWEDSKKHMKLHYSREMIEDISIIQPLDYSLP